jgi:hypothetical protein
MRNICNDNSRTQQTKNQLCKKENLKNELQLLAVSSMVIQYFGIFPPAFIDSAHVNIDHVDMRNKWQ